MMFDKSFDTGESLPLPLGRIYLGQHVVRHVLIENIGACLVVSDQAIKDGRVIVTKTPEQPFGLMKA